MDRIQGTPAPIHAMPASERLLAIHSSVGIPARQPATALALSEIVDFALELLETGATIRHARNACAEHFPAVSAGTINKAIKKAGETLIAENSSPAELRRAIISAQRRRVIAYAIARGEASAALRGLDREGEIAGELQNTGLSPDDLILTVEVEECQGVGTEER